MIHLDRHWDRWDPLVILLLPLALLFRLVAASRRACYRWGWCHVERFPVPVVVVGNITVGGTGKTPLVIWLANYLQQQGWRPGIVSRGYGGQARHWPQQVRPDSDPVMVGDEAVLLAAGSRCPVCVGPDRPAAVAKLLAYHDCDIVLSDDGLQHYALGRDLEIVVVDGERRFGNGLPLPAGPLRESAGRLAEADLVIAQGSAGPGEFAMTVGDAQVLPLRGGLGAPLASWAARPVHAVAGIGNPGRFFASLRDAGLQVTEHAFADHHPFRPDDLAFGDDLPVLMTSKDAVKCRRFAQPHHYEVAVQAAPAPAFVTALAQKLEELPRG
jgi:tetraacyldisaccharide 4'-kinase